MQDNVTNTNGFTLLEVTVAMGLAIGITSIGYKMLKNVIQLDRQTSDLVDDTILSEWSSEILKDKSSIIDSSGRPGNEGLKNCLLGSSCSIDTTVDFDLYRRSAASRMSGRSNSPVFYTNNGQICSGNMCDIAMTTSYTPKCYQGNGCGINADFVVINLEMEYLKKGYSRTFTHIIEVSKKRSSLDQACSDASNRIGDEIVTGFVGGGLKCGL